MTQKEANQLLINQLEKMNEKTESAKNTDEYLSLVDGMLKVYTILTEANAFENENFPESKSDYIS